MVKRWMYLPFDYNGQSSSDSDWCWWVEQQEWRNWEWWVVQQGWRNWWRRVVQQGWRNWLWRVVQQQIPFLVRVFLLTLGQITVRLCSVFYSGSSVAREFFAFWHSPAGISINSAISKVLTRFEAKNDCKRFHGYSDVFVDTRDGTFEGRWRIDMVNKFYAVEYSNGIL